MNPRRRVVVRGRRRYVLCFSRFVATPHAVRGRPVRSGRSARVWFPLTALLLVLVVYAVAAGRLDTLPPDYHDGVPVASVAHYSFDDFANSQR